MQVKFTIRLHNQEGNYFAFYNSSSQMLVKKQTTIFFAIACQHKIKLEPSLLKEAYIHPILNSKQSGKK